MTIIAVTEKGEPTMTCKDCFHRKVCNNKTKIVKVNSRTWLYHLECADVEKYCDNFKNKADYAEVKHGKWKISGNEKECSVCGFVYYSKNDKWNGCPNCLSKMDG